MKIYSVLCSIWKSTRFFRLYRLAEGDGFEKSSPVLFVSGADLVDGTPIYDIKPYLAYADCHPNATCGFLDDAREKLLEVEISGHLPEKLPYSKREALRQVLALDPRPSYREDGKRIYGFGFAGYEFRFRVQGNYLTVEEIEP